MTLHLSPPTRSLALARRALKRATAEQRQALSHPEDYRADLAARTFARDALHFAQQAEAVSPPPGVIIRT